MILGEKQAEFSYLISLLISYIYKSGFKMSFGDAKATEGHIKNSFHYSSLALDINLKDSNLHYLEKTSDHEKSGLFWESIGGTWGGRWGDGNHYSYGEKRYARKS